MAMCAMHLRSAGPVPDGSLPAGAGSAEAAGSVAVEPADTTNLDPFQIGHLGLNIYAAFKASSNLDYLPLEELRKEAFTIAKTIADLVQKKDFFEHIGCHWRFSKTKRLCTLPYSFHLVLEPNFLQINLVPPSSASASYSPFHSLEGAYKIIRMTNVFNLVFNEDKNPRDLATAGIVISPRALIKSKDTFSAATILSSFLFFDQLPEEHVAKDYEILYIRFVPLLNGFVPDDEHIKELKTSSNLLEQQGLSSFVPEDLRTGTNYRYKAKLELTQTQYATDLYEYSRPNASHTSIENLNQLATITHALDQTVQVFDSLEKEGKIRHSDPKAKNIFLDKDAEAYVGDLDLVRDVPTHDSTRWIQDPLFPKYLSPRNTSVKDYVYWDAFAKRSLFFPFETYGFLISAMETLIPDFANWKYQSRLYDFRYHPEQMLQTNPQGLCLFEIFFLEKMKALSRKLATMPGSPILTQDEFSKIEQSTSLEELSSIWDNLITGKTNDLLVLTEITSRVMDSFHELYKSTLKAVQIDQANTKLFNDHPLDFIKKEESGDFFLCGQHLQQLFSINEVQPHFQTLSENLVQLYGLYSNYQAAPAEAGI